MLNTDDHWVCVADLFAGLMAFFVFVTTAIILEFSDREDDLLSRFYEINNATDYIIDVEPPVGVSINGNVLTLASAFFENDSSAIAEEKKPELEKACNIIAKNVEVYWPLDSNEDLSKLVPGNSVFHAHINSTMASYKEIGTKIKYVSFVGYSSCRYKPEEDDSDIVDDEIKMYLYNTELALNRALNVKKFCIKHTQLSAYEPILRLVPGAESIAARNINNLNCCNREIDKELESDYRLVEVKLESI